MALTCRTYFYSAVYCIWQELDVIFVLEVSFDPGTGWYWIFDFLAFLFQHQSWVFVPFSGCSSLVFHVDFSSNVCDRYWRNITEVTFPLHELINFLLDKTIKADAALVPELMTVAAVHHVVPGTLVAWTLCRVQDRPLEWWVIQRVFSTIQSHVLAWGIDFFCYL